jgi:hypothetical protein
MLLKHLGPGAARSAFLFGPIGLPAPFRWAPLCFSACSGTLLNGDLTICSTERGLIGEWLYQIVELKAVSDPVEHDPNGYPSFVTSILGSRVDRILFTTREGQEIFATVYHLETDLTSWGKKAIALLGPSRNVEIDVDGEWSWYSLASIDEILGNSLWQMHRIGSVFGSLSRAQFLASGRKCYGILS